MDVASTRAKSSSDLPEESAPLLTPLPRPAVSALPPYVPGARPAPDERLWKLSSNENPYPPLPEVAAAISEAAGAVNRYPDMYATEVAAAIAEFVEVNADQVVVGNGSVAILAHILSAFVEAGRGDEVVMPWRSFEAYPIAVDIAGGQAVKVPLTMAESAETTATGVTDSTTSANLLPNAGGRLDLPAMAAAVTPNTRVMLVCTPNNPTGQAVRRDELDALLAAVPPQVLVVIDEAYLEFITDPAAGGARALVEQGAHRQVVESGRSRLTRNDRGRNQGHINLLHRHPNVVLLRTFSKAYGLAGLRVGYAVAADAQVAAAIRAVATPFGVSGVAQEAALASLRPEAQAEMVARVDALIAERNRVMTTLRAQGWELPDSQANFLWFPFGADTAARAAEARAAGILARPFTGEGLRVTIGEPAANNTLLALAATWR
ncbi:MAG: aminotransferase class I/II-fold pyridoxal phosphate-dependent enzyme [Promicromonosporaceae bacterium]|nr:aminotransferase class I/II-fold pyridoxal phosphate-dependent enzyme [Promicromonosporaceae bacterium]